MLENRTENIFERKYPPLSSSEATVESSRCINCFDAPCITACPTGINIPQFIKRIQDGNLEGSADTILESNILGLSCSKACPVEVLCVGACVYNAMDAPPIPIGKLQEYALLDFFRKKRKIQNTAQKQQKKVALIGSGPASLSCAAYLSLSGVQTVIFEKNKLPGGLNTTGIAPYKLKMEEAMQEIELIHDLGVEIRLETEVEKNISLEQLTQEFDAIFIGAGLSDDAFPLQCNELSNCFGATEIIAEIKTQNLDRHKKYRKVIVIGGGNTALDVAQELAQLGVPQVQVFYRKNKQAMSGYQHELKQALHNGAIFYENLSPKEIISQNDKALGINFMNLDGTIIYHEADAFIFATGQNKHPLQDIFPQLKIDSGGCVVVDKKTFQTSLPNIYAGGDCINGGKEVVNAVYDGRQAAYNMLKKWNIKIEYGRFID